MPGSVSVSSVPECSDQALSENLVYTEEFCELGYLLTNSDVAGYVFRKFWFNSDCDKGLDARGLILGTGSDYSLRHHAQTSAGTQAASCPMDKGKSKIVPVLN